MGHVLQDHRAAGQRRCLGDDLVGGSAGYRQLREDLMQPLGRPQLGELGVDDPGVHRFGDLDELRLPLEHDEGQLVQGGSCGERGRQAALISRAKLDGQGADPDGS